MLLNESLSTMYNQKANLVLSVTPDFNPINPLHDEIGSDIHIYLDHDNSDSFKPIKPIDALRKLFKDPNKFDEIKSKFTSTSDLFMYLHNYLKGSYYITPISKLDHSQVIYSTGAKSGWDVSVIGFAYGDVNDFGKESDFINNVNNILDNYSRNLNGEVYELAIWDADNLTDMANPLDAISNSYLDPYDIDHLLTVIQSMPLYVDEIDQEVIDNPKNWQPIKLKSCNTYSIEPLEINK